MTELERLLKEKKSIERRINFLTSGSIINENCKVDRINYSYYQKEKWALYYKYRFIAAVSRDAHPEHRSKFMPLVNGDTVEEVVEKIPEVIKALTELYDMYKQSEGEQHGTDT